MRSASPVYEPGNGRVDGAGQGITGKRQKEGKVGEMGGEAGRAGVEVTVADFRYTDQAKWEGDVVVEGSQMTGVPRGGLDRELGRIRWGGREGLRDREGEGRGAARRNPGKTEIG